MLGSRGILHASVVFLAAALITIVVLAGCQVNNQSILLATPTINAIERVEPTATTTPTATPTLTYTPPPPPTLIPQQPPPTRVKAKCQADLELVLDLSLAPAPDGSIPVIPMGSAEQKGWRARNTGTCLWDSSYQLMPGEGNPEWAQTGLTLPATIEIKPGEMDDFWVDFTSPFEPGIQHAEWTLQNSLGEVVGLPLTVDFEIILWPTETARPNITLLASELKIFRGEDTIVSWSTIGAKEIYFYPLNQYWLQHPVEANGSLLLEPDKTTTYELRAVMGDDSIETSRITIEIIPFDAPKVVAFRLKPANVVDLGQCVNIEWVINGRVYNVKLFRNDNFLVESDEEAGSSWDCPEHTGLLTYTIQVTGPGGTTEVERHLEVR